MSDLHEFLNSIGFTIDETAPHPLRGLSNRNVLVRSNGVECVVRLANQAAHRFGIDRAAEMRALTMASEAGLGPEIVHYVLPEGHLISKAIPAEGVGQNPDRYREPENLRRITRAVKRIHALPAIGPCV